MDSVQGAIEKRKEQLPILLKIGDDVIRLSPGGYFYVTWQYRTMILTQQDTRDLIQFLQDGLRIVEETTDGH